jgi:hypothetical protein
MTLGASPLGTPLLALWNKADSDMRRANFMTVSRIEVERGQRVYIRQRHMSQRTSPLLPFVHCHGREAFATDPKVTRRMTFNYTTAREITTIIIGACAICGIFLRMRLDTVKFHLLDWNMCG